ncbi:MAG: hypothetical protein ACKO5I_06965 [Ignavibacteria bacterium]
MKRIVLIVCSLFIACLSLQAQVQDFKTKNSSNQAQRTKMLDLLRGEIRKSIRHEVVFVVDHFKVAGEYAWFEGSVQRKDGGQITFPEDEHADCCKATCLFVKRGSNWSIAEYGAFGTDVWWVGIGNRFPRAPRSIFPIGGLHYE